MKTIFIGATLIVTLTTFYSALWHRSGAIERDIEGRVSDALAKADVSDISVDVDGRHVTLSGVVHDADAESRYLKLADDTYGALGPVDGLTFVANRGFVSAVKTEAGIRLSGSVPDEVTRAALVAEAEAAADGAVTDALEVSGPRGAWHDEAGFGIGQLAAMSAGTVTAGAGAYVLSGTAKGDPADINSAVADRAGWQGFVSAPDASGDFLARISALETDLSGVAGERDLALSGLAEEQSLSADLRAELASLQSDLTDIQGERDKALSALVDEQAVSAELSARLATLEGDVSVERATLLDDLSSKTALVADRDSTIGRLNTEIGDLRTGFAAERAALQAEIEAQGAAVDARDTTIASLQSELDGLRSSVGAEQEDLLAELSSKTALAAEQEEEIAGLTGDIAAMQSEFGAERDGLQSALAARDATIGALTGERDAALARIGELAERASEAEAEVADLSIQLAAANGVISERDVALADFAEEQSGLLATIGESQGVIAERDATIAALRARTGSNVEQCAARANQVIEGSRVNFVTGSAEIEADSVALLERMTGIALACVGEGVAIEIGGHTDDQGDAEDNQVLSEDRAAAVVAFMEERGVPAEGLLSFGYGETRPVADNSTAEGRAENRRISFGWQAR